MAVPGRVAEGRRPGRGRFRGRWRASCSFLAGSVTAASPLRGIARKNQPSWAEEHNAFYATPGTFPFPGCAPSLARPHRRRYVSTGPRRDPAPNLWAGALRRPPQATAQRGQGPRPRDAATESLFPDSGTVGAKRLCRFCIARFSAWRWMARARCHSRPWEATSCPRHRPPGLPLGLAVFLCGVWPEAAAAAVVRCSSGVHRAQFRTMHDRAASAVLSCMSTLLPVAVILRNRRVRRITDPGHCREEPVALGAIGGLRLQPLAQSRMALCGGVSVRRERRGVARTRESAKRSKVTSVARSRDPLSRRENAAEISLALVFWWAGVSGYPREEDRMKRLSSFLGVGPKKRHSRYEDTERTCANR